MTLLPMTKFVKEYYSDESRDELQTLDLFDNYATFLLQPLTLGMFVPIDEEGNVLEEPEFYEHYKNSGFPLTGNDITQKQSDKAKKYCKAKEKVLFEGFAFFGLNKGEIVGYVKNENIDLVYSFPNHRNYTIEDLCQYKIELTPSALKQIGGCISKIRLDEFRITGNNNNNYSEL